MMDETVEGRFEEPETNRIGWVNAVDEGWTGD